MTDPMLAKAERIELELLKRAQLAPKHGMDERVMERAALLIQQMRIRLNGADIELANEVKRVAEAINQCSRSSTVGVGLQDRWAALLNGAVAEWRTAVGIEGDEWPIDTESTQNGE